MSSGIEAPMQEHIYKQEEGNDSRPCNNVESVPEELVFHHISTVTRLDILSANDEPNRERKSEDIKQGFFHDVIFEGPEVRVCICVPAFGAAAGGEEVPDWCCDEAGPHGPDGEDEEDVGVEAVDANSESGG